MKKTLIASLISVAVIATMITAAACAAKKSATVKAAAPAIQETAAEATEEIINDGQNPVMNFIGDYVYERVFLRFTN